jgi:DNA-binding NtrC family response regulator
MTLLAAYRWPGNVRQLENTIFRAVVLADDEELGVNEFPQIAAQVSSDALAAQPLIEPSPAMVASWPEPGNALGGSLGRNIPTPATAAHSLPLTDPQGEVRPLDDIERDAIRFAISHYRGQMSEVARRLRIGRSTLYRKLEGLGLDEDAAAQ